MAKEGNRMSFCSQGAQNSGVEILGRQWSWEKGDRKFGNKSLGEKLRTVSLDVLCVWETAKGLKWKTSVSE